jgi:hypothetical protein
MKNIHILPKEEPKQIKCYCGHTITCDCGPLEEPKQETLEEAAEKYWSKQPYNEDAFIEGAKWQQERMYSEEEVEQMINSFEKLCYNYQSNKDWFPSKKSEWFEQFKKK